MTSRFELLHGPDFALSCAHCDGSSFVLQIYQGEERPQIECVNHAAHLAFFEAQPAVPDGTIRVLNANGDVCIEQPPKEQP